MKENTTLPGKYINGAKRISVRKYKILDTIFPDRILNGLFNIREYKIPPLSQNDRYFLHEYYKEYNEKLFDLLGVRKTWNNPLT